MSKYAVMPLTDYTNTCNVIREKGNITEPIKSGEMSEKINDVYGAGHNEGFDMGKREGYNEGFGAGLTQGFEDGTATERSYSWDFIQNYGELTSYKNFCYRNKFIVDKETTPRFYFFPKYDLYPIDAGWMFREFNAQSSGSKAYANITIDFTQWLADLGVKLDMSRCTDASCMFYNNKGFSRVPFLDLSKCTNLANFIAYSNIRTFDGIKSSATTAWTSTTFGAECNFITHCPFHEDSVIAKNFYGGNLRGIDKESLVSIVNALSETTSGLTATLSKTAVTNAFGSTESDEWVNLVNTKPNWTVSLV